VEFDTNDSGGFTGYYESDCLAEVMDWVTEDLKEHGGGHADIHDADGDFREDVEV
jgi:hypothetical protein